MLYWHFALAVDALAAMYPETVFISGYKVSKAGSRQVQFKIKWFYHQTFCAANVHNRQVLVCCSK